MSGVVDGGGATGPLARALAEAEEIIRSAPHVRTEEDVAEGLEYLLGTIRGVIESGQHRGRSHPQLFQATGPYTKMGLDNPDTLYFYANLTDGAEYVVEGRRGTTADLSFQVMAGTYSADERAASHAAFDDRALVIDSGGRYSFRLGPPRGDDDEGDAGYVVLRPGTTMIAVREVYSDWDTEEAGTATLRRVDAVGTAPEPVTLAGQEKFYGKLAGALTGRLQTWLAFPGWFFGEQERNTLNEPRQTPGGLTTQYSSAGVFELESDQALVISVPVAGVPYQGFQLGSMWYASLEYVHHQTSLTADQAHVSADGMVHLVVSDRDPGLANWIETLGHREGIMQFRWQRTCSPITPELGPTVRMVRFDELADAVPGYTEQRVTGEQWRERIAARQRAFADRSLT
ncbi:hypothetical protein [Rhodococcus sp. IEGM 1408]|uniref:hypothetical protein n=1 Tax=Rhodococcus sp. IEGM 1408 TaxID=3082220 RepID=UPI002954B813|nr:hypothetical protein [Rhodococcus sp. IEGM 1408]MDV8002515.1 hypothetical protein [Rhodococcus sp. IEGM 1408]